MTIQKSGLFSMEFKRESTYIHFPEGLLGFRDLKNFSLMSDTDIGIFSWLENYEKPEMIFPLIEPVFFAPKLNFDLTQYDLEAVQVESEKDCCIFSILAIPEDDPSQMTANTKAPLVINKKANLGHQCIIQKPQLSIQEPIFAQLRQRVFKELLITKEREAHGENAKSSPPPSQSPCSFETEA